MLASYTAHLMGMILRLGPYMREARLLMAEFLLQEGLGLGQAPILPS
jgi:hypothetical protein